MSPNVTFTWPWDYLADTAILKGTHVKNLDPALTAVVRGLAERPQTDQRASPFWGLCCLLCRVTLSWATEPESW